MKYYKEFLITTEPFLPEIVSGVMWELNIDGINEEVNCIKVFAQTNSNVGKAEIELQLHSLTTENIIRNYSVEENLLPMKNWNEEWEKSIQVIHVTDRIIIKPTFREYEKKENEIVITLDPKMSFGTGEHQTTKIVLSFLQKYVDKDISFLDVGSGTAVLAIAAVKLGAANAIAIDTDEWCYTNGIENCSLNSLADRIDVRQCELIDVAEKNFDLIAANIQKNVLIEIADEIRKRISTNGKLILSGLLITDETEISDKYNSLGFQLVDKLQLDEWIGLVLSLK
jgi:ribosomal protein L11 methyltransferase